MTLVNYDKDKLALYSIRNEKEKILVFVDLSEMVKMNNLHRIYKGLENVPDEEIIEVILSVTSIVDDKKVIVPSDNKREMKINNLIPEWVAIN